VKLIPETFNHSGYTYNLMKRSDKVALYHVIGKDPCDTKKNYTVAYEVHKIRIRSPRTYNIADLQGKTRVIETVLREVLASDSDFGQYAWAFRDLELAENRFNSLPRSRYPKISDLGCEVI
jgi:hypothetical protein